MKKYIIIMMLCALPLAAMAQDTPEYKWENKVIGAPLASFAPETSWSGILTGAYLYKTGAQEKDTPASSLEFYSEYTAKNQSDISLELNNYGEKYAWYTNAYIEYKKYPDTFFGTGNYTSAGDGESYTPEFFKLRVMYLASVYPKVLAGVRYKLEKHNVLSRKTNGLLDTGDYAGSRGSLLSGVSLIARWDTRDSTQFARSGLFYQGSIDIFPSWLGSSGSFAQVTADLRHFYPLFDEKNSLSTQLNAVFTAGNSPIDAMGQLGGSSIMRGLYGGMFRDNNMVTLQAEYKWLCLDWMSISAFGGIGEVSPSVTAFSTAGIKYSYGGGLHFIVDSDSKMTLRLDFGFGENTSGMYITTLEAF